MPGRINTKFLIILVIVLVAVAAVSGGLYYAAAYETFDELIVLGDEAMAAGEFRRARNHFGRAAKRRPGAVDVLVKYYDAASKVKVEAGAEANKAYNQMQGVIRGALRESPGDKGIFQRLMDSLILLGRELGQVTVWDEIVETTEKTFEINPNLIEARKYRGIAQVVRMIGRSGEAGLNLQEEERQQAREDLRAYLDQQPDDEDASYHLAQWHVAEIGHLRYQPGIKAKDLDDLRDQAIAIVQSDAESYPDDTHRHINHAQVLMYVSYTLKRDDAEKARARVLNDKAAGIVAAIEAGWAQAPGSRRNTLTLANLIQQAAIPEEGEKQTPEQKQAVLDRVAKVMQVVVESHPKDLLLKVNYCDILVKQQKLDVAMSILEQIREQKVRATPVEAYLQTFAQRQGLAIQVDLLMRKAEAMQDGEARSAEFDKIEPMLKELQAAFGEVPVYQILAGRLAAMRNDWADALNYFRQANTKTRGTDGRLLWRLATALEKRRQGGAAIKTLEQLMAMEGASKFVPARYMLIRLNTHHKQFDEAEQHINALAEDRPDDPNLKAFRADLARALGDTEQALKLLGEMDSDINPRVIYSAVDVLLKDDREDEARSLLVKRLEAEPTDTTALTLLIRITPDKDRALGYVKIAREGGLSGEWIESVEKQLKGEIQPRDIYVKQYESFDDPVQRLQFKYAMHLRFGEVEEAEASLLELEKIDKNNPWLVGVRFERAMAVGDWESAKVMANRAQALDLDRAQGLFYYGRLDVAQNRFERAATSFDEGLNKRPDYSAGWVLLGDAQMRGVNLEAAADSYKKALELVPDNVSALLGLAQLEDSRQNNDTALVHLKKAFDYQPDNRHVRNNYVAYEQEYGDKESALAKRREWAESEPDDSQNRRQLALLLADMDQLRQANDAIDALIEEQGASLGNTRVRAELFLKIDDAQTARDILQNYVVGLGEEATMQDWVTLGRFLMEHQGIEPGVSAFNRAIDMENDNRMPATRELAQELTLRGQLEKAKPLYEKIYAANKEDVALAQLYAEVMLKMQDIAKAKEILAEISSVQGVDEKTYLLEAMIAAAENDVPLAFTKLDQAEQLAPHRAMIHMQRARLLFFSTSNRGEALAAVNRALQYDPRMIEARLLKAKLLAQTNEPQQAIAELQAVLSAQDDHRDARMTIAQLYIFEDQKEQARRILTESAEKYPTESVWWSMISQVAAAEGKATEASRHARTAFEIEANAGTLRDLGLRLIYAKRPAQAQTVLREHVEILDQNPILYSVLGWAFAADDQTDTAQRAFDKAIAACRSLGDFHNVTLHMYSMGRENAMSYLGQSLNENNAQAIHLIIATHEVENRRYDQAITRLGGIDADVAMDSEMRPLLDQQMAFALHYTEQYGPARDAYLRLLKNLPNDTTALNNISFLLCENLDAPDEALQYIRRADDLLPNNYEILDTYGWVLFKAGQPEEAYRKLIESVESNKTAANCLHLAHVLVQRKDSSGRTRALELAKTAERLAKRYRDTQTQQEAAELVRQIESAAESENLEESASR